MTNRHGLAVILVMAACTGSDPSDDPGDPGALEDTARSMEGIYRVSSYTRNDAACEPGGTSRLGLDGFAFAKLRPVLGHPLLEVISCASPEDCRAKLAAIEASESFGLEFWFTASRLGPDGTLLGEGASTGSHQNDGVCTLGEVTSSTFALAGGDLRIERAITIADDYPTPEPNTCTTRGAQAAAEGNPCSAMEVLEAELVEDL